MPGHDAVSLGICMVGRETNHTGAQWRSLSWLVRLAVECHRGAKVIGHRDLEPVKKRFCPGFDAKARWAREAASAFAKRARGDAA